MDLTIITAVAPDRDDFLHEAAKSVSYLRNYLSVQWIVAWDGQANRQFEEASTTLEGRADSGISCTRNLALPYICAPVVASLDADDKIVAEGVLAAMNALSATPSLGWVALSRCFLDGTPTRHSFGHEQSFQPGELAESWSAPFPFHPNSVILRTELLSLVGGWPAIVSNEDLGVILRISELAGGMMIPQVLTQYRTWQKQEVAKASYAQTKKLAFDYIASTINQLRVSLDRAPILPPSDPGGAHGTEALLKK